MSTAEATTTISMNALDPIDQDGLNKLADKGKSNPDSVVTLKARTVCEGKFRNLTYVRDLDAHVIDEPPHLLGDDTAPNPSEAALASLGACLSVGMHANAIDRGITLTKLELSLEGDINVTAVWGVGDTDKSKRLGFTDIRVKVDLEGDASEEELQELVAHADFWSPVANTMRNPVNVAVEKA
ncbi:MULTISPECIES: OsmC family protein [unclassified Thioalkalivibrio]|uniref:OsmC family protein n=1 Tax=unclassified Thioalkalivibrio TaxID=2621013 RepID=UPI000360F2F8|nr:MULTISPECIES: OsmC family protein [unclassified Thioalkalivibrio]PYG02769.1 putative OsmC-like protein [Thioalkalivibrio sp. ALE21]